MTYSATWADLDRELERWSAQGLKAIFWIRDDDATAITPALCRLEKLVRRYQIELGLAIVPGRLQAGLADHLKSGASPFVPMCHGWLHTNHADASNPSEFGAARPLPAMRSDLIHARQIMERELETNAPFFVPPFGQISPMLVRELPGIGFAGLSNQNSRTLSRFVRLARSARLLPTNVLRFPIWRSTLDAHVDPIDWMRSTARTDEQVIDVLLGELMLRRKHYKPVSAPIGLLGHHLVHDEAIWTLLEKLIERLRANSSVLFPPLSQLTSACEFAAAGRARSRNAASTTAVRIAPE